jgi:aryl-alcohol dehydrogenase-like predicted oxidoreductase
MGDGSVPPEKIIFGTMRLLEAARTAEETAEYLVELHELGVRSAHSSLEYESFALFTDALKVLERNKPGLHFRHMVKLAVPSFDDDDSFSADLFRRRIDEYRQKLRADTIDIVQWMWRRKLESDADRVLDFLGNAAAIQEAAESEKARGSIRRFFCFPYSPSFASAALQAKEVDGLAIYRNLHERDYDFTLGSAEKAGKSAIVIRPFFGGKLAEGADPAKLLRAALDGPAIEAAVLSTNSLAHMKALVC